MPAFPDEDRTLRDQVLGRIRECVRLGQTVPMSRRPDSPFCGLAGEFRYLFEGEDDLLHLVVERLDGGPLTIADSQSVARFLLFNVPEAMVFLRPGERAHHFYFGHDFL
jgi:hypothetical protein